MQLLEYLTQTQKNILKNSIQQEIMFFFREENFPHLTVLLQS